MNKKQKYILTIFLSFIFLFILTSIVSYQKITSYHKFDNTYYIALTERYIQPFYNITSQWIWCIGIIFLILFTYIYFRKYDDPVYKKYSVDYKLLLKATFSFIGILYFIIIFGVFSPTFGIGEEKIRLLSQTEYEENTNINDSDFDEFDKGSWIEI